MAGNTISYHLIHSGKKSNRKNSSNGRKCTRTNTTEPFEVRESYYQLLREARITWQKGEQINPRQDEETISKKNLEIAELLEKHRGEIEAVPILNPKEKQTYYGALNLLTREFTLIPYPTGNGEFTVNIVKRLFQFFVDLKLFNIPDLKKYDAFSRFI